MKIAVIGYSGSGKSTLARGLAEHYGILVLHLDSIHFLPEWQERSLEDECRLVSNFLDMNSDWIIDGNYSKVCYLRRMEEADKIIILLFGRFSCFWRAWYRSRVYKNRTRPDMGPGCTEKFDREFAWWILHKGRVRQKKQRYRQVRREYPSKVVVVRNQRQLNRLMNSM